MTGFDDLYETHFPAVYRICLAQFRDAEFAAEITQEAFSRAFAQWESLRDVDRFLTWVTAIALHFGYLKANQAQARSNELPPDEMLDLAWTSTSTENPDTDEQNFIRRWILTLKDDDQQIFLLKHYYLLTDEEIAQVVGKAESTVNYRRGRLIGMLEQELQKYRNE